MLAIKDYANLKIQVHHCMKDKRIDIYRMTDEDGNQHIYIFDAGTIPSKDISFDSIDNRVTLERKNDILTYKCPFIVNMARTPSFRSAMKDFEGANIGQ